MFDLVKLERVLGVHFMDPDLCREAFTHKSFAAEHNLKYDNQRLELLGDSVVQIILTEELFKRYPDLQEGALTKIRSAIVNQDSLASFARELSLGEFLMLGKGEIELGGADRDSTISDLFEAFTGALYLDQGLEVARRFFMGLVNRQYPEPSSVLISLNPKGELQEHTQRLGIGVPVYHVLSVTGPGHCPVYEVEVSIPGCDPVVAAAPSRKHAEGEAARKLLNQLKIQASGEQDAQPK